MPLLPIQRQHAVVAEFIHPQSQCSLLHLPNELLANIFERLSPVDLARFEEVSRLSLRLTQPAWPKACGPQPLHRALSHIPDYKQLAREQVQIRRAQTQRMAQDGSVDIWRDPAIVVNLAVNTYLQDAPRRCTVFAEETLCSLQQHPERGAYLWHQACAALLMMQRRFDEAQLHIDRLSACDNGRPEALLLIATRYGGPLAIAVDTWHTFGAQFRHRSLLGAIAGHQHQTVDALMDLDAPTPHTRLRYTQAASIAARHNNIAALRALVGNGAQVDGVPPWVEGTQHFGCAPMWEAAYHGHTEIVSYLASWNIEGDRISDGRGHSSPLDAAIAQNHVDVVNVLMCTLPQHARVMTDHNLRLANLLAPDRAHTAGRRDMLDALVGSWGIPINMVDGQNRSFLHYAAEGGDAELTARALELGANPAREDCTGQTPLELAVNTGSKSVIDILTQHRTTQMPSTLNYQVKLDLARAMVSPILAAQEPLLRVFANHWHQQMAPAQFSRLSIFDPEMSWFVDDMQDLYTRTFSMDTLCAWRAHYTQHPTINLARQLSDVMRLIRQGSYLLPSTQNVPQEHRMQISAICRAWLIKPGRAAPLRIEDRDAFFQVVAQGITNADRVALLSLAQSPFGARLAAGMRRKYEAETRLWNAFGLFTPRRHPANP